MYVHIYGLGFRVSRERNMEELYWDCIPLFPTNRQKGRVLNLGLGFGIEGAGFSLTQNAIS